MYCQNKCIHIESPYGTHFSSQIDKVQFNDRADHIFLGLYIELMLKAERAKTLWIKSLKYCVIIYSSLSLHLFICVLRNSRDNKSFRLKTINELHRSELNNT